MVSNKFLWSLVIFLVTVTIILGTLLFNQARVANAACVQNIMMVNNLTNAVSNENKAYIMANRYRIALIKEEWRYRILQEKYNTAMRAMEFSGKKYD